MSSHPIDIIPAYRELCAPLFYALDERIRRRVPTLLAIDGRCGSGKTSLAAGLAAYTGCHVFHMDDYYLPFDRRNADWEHGIAQNMDLIRVRDELLLPVHNQKSVVYHPYDCMNSRYLDEISMEYRPLTVIEGSYSQHPLLRDLYDITVFLTIDPATQQTRLMEREGERFTDFRDRWIPMEERYFAACDTAAHSDYVIRTADLRLV